MVKEYLYSLIIPTQNIPNLLERCLESIPTRPDLQIIIVDDNSDPTLVDFDNYPGRDREDVTLIFDKTGKGAGYARNIGLVNASGKWVFFSDSDDIFITENLNTVLNKYSESDADIIYFNTDRINADTGEESSDNPQKKYVEQNDIVAERWLRYKSPVPWGKLIKKDLILKYNIKFSEVPAANDMLFSAHSGIVATKVLMDQTVIYQWLFRSKGNLGSNTTKEALLSRLGEVSKRNRLLKMYGLKGYCDNLYILYYKRLLSVGLTKKESFYLISLEIDIFDRFYFIVDWIVFLVKKSWSHLLLR